MIFLSELEVATQTYVFPHVEHTILSNTQDYVPLINFQRTDTRHTREVAQLP